MTNDFSLQFIALQIYMCSHCLVNVINNIRSDVDKFDVGSAFLLIIFIFWTFSQMKNTPNITSITQRARLLESRTSSPECARLAETLFNQMSELSCSDCNIQLKLADNCIYSLYKGFSVCVLISQLYGWMLCWIKTHNLLKNRPITFYTTHYNKEIFQPNGKFCHVIPQCEFLKKTTTTTKKTWYFISRRFF